MELKKQESRMTKTPKASFIKMNIDIKDEPTVSFWVNLLFIIPFPLILIKLFSGIAAEMATKHSGVEITKEQLLDILNACYGLDVRVETEDVNVDVQFY